jgi:peptidoglycan hydrolase-like protein with peptidoglycan-binding domain
MHSVRRIVLAGALAVGMCGVPAVLTTAQATAARSHAKASTWPLVQKGDTGGRVRAIQYLLNRQIRAGLTVDGIFGTATANAVMTFQKKVGITPAPWVGQKTWPKLIITVKSGDRSAAVRAVQWQLHFEYGYTSVAVDAIFGAKTEAAVKSFQTKYKLTPDGIVGTDTWLALEANHK